MFLRAPAVRTAARYSNPAVLWLSLAGIDACARLRRLAANRTVPVVCIQRAEVLGRDLELGQLRQCSKWQLRTREATVTIPTQPTPMTGALAANFYQGSRSEYLAQFIFSTFGTSLLVPRQEDYGLDLFCAL